MEETHTFLMQLAVILITARLFAEIASRCGMPTVIGELFAGVLLGPSLLGVIEPHNMIRALAEMGVILLLFEVGLETDIHRLVHAGSKAATVAIGGFIFPFVLGFALCHYVFHLETLPALLIGGTLTATSIGITVRVLADLRRRNSNEGQIILGAAVLDDVLGVILLAVLYDFSVGGAIDFGNIGRIVMFVGTFFLVAPPMAKLISMTIHRVERISNVPGLIPVTMVSLVLIFAWLAHFMGAPELLGGFAAGLALSRRFFLPFGIALSAEPEFAGRVSRTMKPILQLLTPIFFVVVGLSLDLGSVDWSSQHFWFFSLSLLAVSIAGKFAGAVVIREPATIRCAIGMCMVPRGEVGLIFAELGRSAGMVDEQTYAVLVIVIAYTTLLAPFWIKLYYRLFRDRINLMSPNPDPATEDDDHAD